MCLTQVRAQQWASVLQQLKGSPAAVPDGIHNLLFKPLNLAYRAIPANAQTCFTRLGALPPLASYDLECFTAVWHSDLAHTTRTFLTLLEHDTGLIRSETDDTGELVWTLHAQVLRYAQVLFQKLPPAEREHATQWADHALYLPAHQKRFQQLMAHPPLTVGALFARQSFKPSIRWSKPAQIARLLTCPTHVTEWERLETNQRNFSSTEYILGWRLRRSEIWSRWMIPLYGMAMTVVIVLTRLTDPQQLKSEWSVWLWILVAIADALLLVALGQAFFQTSAFMAGVMGTRARTNEFGESTAPQLARTSRSPLNFRWMQKPRAIPSLWRIPTAPLAHAVLTM